MRALLASIVLIALIGSAHAQQPERDQLRAGVWERILVRLDALPERWDVLPPPAVPPSGRLAKQVLDTATEGERQAALALITRLALSPPGPRTQLVAQARQERALPEVDLWVAGELADGEKLRDIDQAGLTIEAWLELAEQLGRRDVLLRAAGAALSLALLRIPPAHLAAPARRWSMLPSGPHGTQGAADVNVVHGTILWRIGRHREALDAYRRARQLHGSVGDKRGQGNTWDGEAKVLAHLGRYASALQAFRQARSLYIDVGDKLGQGNTWDGEAWVLFRLGQHDGALQAFRQARSLYIGVDGKLGQGNTWQGEAWVLFRLGQHNGALQAFRQARSLYIDAVDKVGQGNTWRGEADLLARLGRNATALQAYRHARALLVDMGHKLGQGNTWRGEADVRLRLGALGPALRAAHKAARLAKNVGAIKTELEASISEARILLASKQNAQAIRRSEDALALLRRWRQKGLSDLDRTAMADTSAPYDLLIPLLVRRRGRAVEQAFALAEEAHAPLFLDLLATGSRRAEDTDDPSLRKERQRLQRQRATLDRKLEAAIAPGERQKLRRERAAVDAHLEINELVTLGSMRSTLVSGTPIDARTRRALVRDVGAVLLYYVAEDQTVAFLLQPGQRAPLVRFIGLSREQLQREVQALRHRLANPRWEQDAHARQRALLDQLVAPFATALEGSARLTIIPHGPLHELPFEALLLDDTTPLFARWHVSIAPSLSALHAVRARRAKRPLASHELAFVGIAGGTGLKLSGPAVTDVGAGFGAAVHIVSPGPGSYPAYLEHAPRARHLLVATHGTHVAHSRSGHLELAATEGHATRLTASEIAQHPLRAELVTLAACETARGEAMLSDERLDLTRAFLIAGADAVLATRWKVPEDEGTRLFLLDFYQALRQGGPGGTPLRKDEALTEARRRARARGDDAQLWAAWVLVGDAR